MTEKKEYIEREATLRNLADDLPYKASVKRVLMQAPVADVVEMKHGEWTERVYDGNLKCSLCEEHYPWGVAAFYRYCPNCGAKMDGERKEQG